MSTPSPTVSPKNPAPATRHQVSYDETASPMDFRAFFSDRDRRAVSLKFKNRRAKFKEKFAR